jgi:hypothetical protein
VRFTLPDEVRDLQQAITRWNSQRPIIEGFDLREWQQFLNWGLLPSVGDVDGELPATAVALMEVSRRGLPGPVLEASLVMQSSARAREVLQMKGVVTSVTPGPAGPSMVGWGAVADLVVDQESGKDLATGPLPSLTTAYVHPHGWWERSVATSHSVSPELKWCLASALITGLARGALDLAVGYSKDRHQFGQPIAAFQAVQFPLAECKSFVEGTYWMALDAALRLHTEKHGAGVACALAWLCSVRTARLVSEACHQAFGAAGLANETGLNELTWGMRWLVQTEGTSRAHAYLRERRLPDTSGVGCLVHERFAQDPTPESLLSAGQSTLYER